MAWEITTEELLKKYTSGKRNFAGAVVIRERGYDRQFIDLEGAVLRGINLRGCDSSFADLKGSEWSRSLWCFFNRSSVGWCAHQRC